jgi:phage baseplate assembly protein W
MKGERVMRPDEGCSIWDYVEEPFTDSVREQIITEAIRICQADTRLTVVNVNVATMDQGLRVEIVLNYVPWGAIGTFTTDFNSRQTNMWSDTGSN